jgi:hypothetical protein
MPGAGIPLFVEQGRLRFSLRFLFIATAPPLTLLSDARWSLAVPIFGLCCSGAGFGRRGARSSLLSPSSALTLADTSKAQ